MPMGSFSYGHMQALSAACTHLESCQSHEGRSGDLNSLPKLLKRVAECLLRDQKAFQALALCEAMLGPIDQYPLDAE